MAGYFKEKIPYCQQECELYSNYVTAGYLETLVLIFLILLLH